MKRTRSHDDDAPRQRASQARSHDDGDGPQQRACQALIQDALFNDAIQKELIATIQMVCRDDPLRVNTGIVDSYSPVALVPLFASPLVYAARRGLERTAICLLELGGKIHYSKHLDQSPELACAEPLRAFEIAHLKTLAKKLILKKFQLNELLLQTTLLSDVLVDIIGQFAYLSDF